MCVLTNKRKKHIERNSYSVAWVMPQGWDFGMLGVKKISMGIFDDAPSNARSSFFKSICLDT